MDQRRNSNLPYAILELTREEHKFLLDNCEANIVHGLSALQGVTSEQHQLATKLVVMLEMFKAIRTKLRSV